MSIYRVSLQFPFDSALPRDVISINPHFSGTDPDALASALQANLNSYGPTTTKPYTIKVYDAQKAPPSFPLATRTLAGTPPVSQMTREVALCLSYYSTYNRPRYRGRLYLIPSWFTGVATLRPSAGTMTAALGFVTGVLTKSLPQAHNWVVYSKVGNQAYGVSNYWVDDEWDTIRSRGLRSTTRQLGVV